MHRLTASIKLPVQLGLIGILFLVPLLLTTYMTADRIHTDLQFLKKEAVGREYLQALWPSFLQQVRGATEAGESTGARDVFQSMIDSHGAAIDSVAVSKDYLAFADQDGRQNEAIAAGLEAFDLIGDGSNLILDGDLASFHAMIGVVQAWPELAAAVHEVSRLATQEATDPASHDQFVLALGRMNDAEAKGRVAISTVFALPGTSAFAAAMRPHLDAIGKAKANYYDHAIKGAEPDVLARSKQDLLDAIDRAWLDDAAQLGLLLDARIRSLSGHLFWSLALVCTMILAALGVMTLIYLGLTGSVKRLVDRMNSLAKGETEGAIPHQTDRNEMGEIARAVVVFRENLIEMGRLEAARLAAEAKALTDREALEHNLRQGFGSVVDAARQGDFSKRAPEGPELGGLVAIAQGLNAVCSAAESFLDDVDAAATHYAQGDLTARISPKFDGKFGLVANNLNLAMTSLANTLSEVRSAADNARGASQEIRHAADDLSSRAEQQAANLEETAAALEEMTASVKQNAENSVEAARSADEASRRAESGGKIAREAVDAMARIEDSAKRIADIIGLIEGIAFQTNLLALNAAVEAVRAGEAGKGFAVVAAEVRTLAQRSSDAAKDVKALIQTSQTEVAAGAKLVNSAGDMLDEILGSAKKAAGMIAGISTASREQAEAASQISSAVAHLDQITQHNSSLAEQSAGSARDMSDQADRLAELIAGFETGHQAQANAVQSASRVMGQRAMTGQKVAAAGGRGFALAPAAKSGGKAHVGKAPRSNGALPRLAASRSAENPTPRADEDDWTEF